MHRLILEILWVVVLIFAILIYFQTCKKMPKRLDAAGELRKLEPGDMKLGDLLVSFKYSVENDTFNWGHVCIVVSTKIYGQKFVYEIPNIAHHAIKLIPLTKYLKSVQIKHKHNLYHLSLRGPPLDTVKAMSLVRNMSHRNIYDVSYVTDYGNSCLKKDLFLPAMPIRYNNTKPQLNSCTKAVLSILCELEVLDSRVLEVCLKPREFLSETTLNQFVLHPYSYVGGF